MEKINRTLGIIAGVILLILSTIALFFFLPTVIKPGYSFSGEPGIYISGSFIVLFLTVAGILFSGRPKNSLLHTILGAILALGVVGFGIAAFATIRVPASSIKNVVFIAMVVGIVISAIPTAALFFRAHILGRR